MKTKIIIIDNQNLSDMDFDFLSKPHELQFTGATIVKLNAHSFGWLGRELRQSVDDGYDDVMLVPIGALQLSVETIRRAAVEANVPLVLNGFNPGPNGNFLSISNDFAYIDLSFFRTNNISIDWGPNWTSQDPILFPNTVEINNVLTPESGKVVGTEYGAGWVLIGAVLNYGGSILNYPIEILNNVVDIADSAMRNQPQVGAAVETVDRWMAFIQEIRPAHNTTSTTLDTVQSLFVNPATPIENLYTTADSLDAFAIQFNYSREFRVVFFSNNADNIEFVKTIIANWDGTNQHSLAVPTHYQTALDNLIAQQPNYFSTIWQPITSGYIAYFEFNGMSLIEDLSTQKHVNNFIFLGNYSFSVKSFVFANVDLASVEICYQSASGYTMDSIFTTGPYTQDLYQRFRITYRNTQSGFQLPTEYVIKPHFLSQKWARALHYDYLEHTINKVEKNFMLQHWEYDENNPNGRSLQQLCIEMNRYVDHINNYFDGSSERRVPYQITQFFDPSLVNQQILNEIHHHFELLIGQVWSVSEYYKLADGGTCFAIRQLNNLCHEMESLFRPSFRNSTQWSAGVYFPFLRVTRYKFIDSDYDHFTQIQYFGDLILHYSQLGKTPLEAFAANDAEVFDDNITGLRYLSGEFDITFRTDVPESTQRVSTARYNVRAFPWIMERGQDPNSKYTGIGFVTIASFDRTLFPGLTGEQIMAELVKCDDIYKVELIDGAGTVVKESSLDYTWRDILTLTDPTQPAYTGEFHW